MRGAGRAAWSADADPCLTPGRPSPLAVLTLNARTRHGRTRQIMTAPRTRRPRRASGSSGQTAGKPPREQPPPAGRESAGCAEGAAQQVTGPAVTATCWLDPESAGQPYPATVSFSGRRIGGSRKPREGDRFERLETVDPVVPGSGPVSVTTKVPEITAGEWIIWAKPAAGPSQRGRIRALPEHPQADRFSVMRFLWTKGNPVAAGNTGTRVTTKAAGFATGPGLIPASWLPLVAVGVIVALAVQAVLAARAHLSVGAAVAVTLAACLAGAAGAKIWFVALNRRRVDGLATQGLCIQGFIAGFVAVLIPGVVLAGLPAGTFFDVSAPGLFFGMAIGRQGCFLHGCCVGRITASRWAIWASDGRVGARRAPTQQLESLACLVIGLAALLLVLPIS